MSLIGQFWHYAFKVFNLPCLLKSVPDPRIYPQIPHTAIVGSLFLGAALRRPSLLQIQADTRRKGWQKLMGYSRPLSDDLMGDTLKNYSLESLRRVLVSINKTLKRNKALEAVKIDGLLVVALDCNEQFSSRLRCCEACCTREITVQGKEGLEKVTEYYHRQVYAQMSGARFSTILDLEELKPGEEECQAALRLLSRMRRLYGRRFFDVVTVDAWYAKGSFIKAVQKMGWGVVCVLKQERFEIYQEATILGKNAPVNSFVSDQWAQPRRVELKEVGDLSFTQESIGKLRVVMAEEQWTENHPQGRKKKTQSKESHWRWLVTKELDGYGTRTIWKIGHNRWGIENHAFNELTQYYHLTHCPRHEPTAILAWLLFLILGFVVFEAFSHLNCKLLRLGKTTLQDIVEQLKESMARWEELEPFWSG